jgi:hypothetical protein
LRDCASLRRVDTAVLPQDALQSTGYKKTQIQKALDTLSESARINCTARLRSCSAFCLACVPLRLTRQLRAQENGKQKIYLALQTQSTVPPEARGAAQSARLARRKHTHAAQAAPDAPRPRSKCARRRAPWRSWRGSWRWSSASMQR